MHPPSSDRALRPRAAPPGARDLSDEAIAHWGRVRLDGRVTTARQWASLIMPPRRALA